MNLHNSDRILFIFLVSILFLIKFSKFVQCETTATTASPATTSSEDQVEKSTPKISTEKPDEVEKEEEEKDAVFHYPEFDYISSPKNEIAWQEWVAACEQTPVCLGRIDLDKLKCMRKCISRSCYQEIYGFDELEEGEIDVRATSFKGCFTQRIQKKRHWD